MTVNELNSSVTVPDYFENSLVTSGVEENNRANPADLIHHIASTVQKLASISTGPTLCRFPLWLALNQTSQKTYALLPIQSKKPLNSRASIPSLFDCFLTCPCAKSGGMPCRTCQATPSHTPIFFAMFATVLMTWHLAVFALRILFVGESPQPHATAVASGHAGLNFPALAG